MRILVVLDSFGYVLGFLGFILGLTATLGPQWCYPLGSPILPLILSRIIKENSGVMHVFGGPNWNSEDFDSTWIIGVVSCVVAAFLLSLLSFMVDRLDLFRWPADSGLDVTDRQQLGYNHYDRHLNQKVYGNQAWNPENPETIRRLKIYKIVSSLWIASGLLNLTAMALFTFYTLERSKNKIVLMGLDFTDEVSELAGVGTFLKCKYGVSYYSGWVAAGMQFLAGVLFLVRGFYFDLACCLGK